MLPIVKNGNIQGTSPGVDLRITFIYLIFFKSVFGKY